jgi:hypothetical protein
VVAGLRLANDLLARSKSSRKSVLVVTESVGVMGFESIAAKMAKQEIRISTLGYQSANRRTLDELARAGQGRAYTVARNKDLPDVFHASTSPASKGANLAVIFVMDASLPNNKLELAKEIVRSSIEILAVDDVVGVVAYGAEAKVIVPLQRASNRAHMSAEVSRVQFVRGTNPFTGLEQAAEQLRDLRGPDKHVIIISDGDGPRDGIVELLQDMRSARIMVSSVGTPGADKNLLSTIAAEGEGRLYMTDDVGALPKLLMHH